MKKALKRFFIVILYVIGALILVVGGYVAYMSLQYYRISDNIPVETKNVQSSVIQSEKIILSLLITLDLVPTTMLFLFYGRRGNEGWY